MELYLDAAATTKIYPEVIKEYERLLENYYGSTGSLHHLGEEALILENKAKEKIANLLHVKQTEILFNSGSTEGNNFAIKGVALQYKNRGKTIITSKVEHPSVLESFKQLENDFGFKCIYLDVNEKGIIDLKQLKEALNNDVILVSIMYVNHELGTIMPIKEIANLLKNYPKVIFHSDITQALGKTPIDFSLMDIATMSGHKIHSLKGSGFLYKKEKVTLYPLISGHPAKNALRAGTSNWMSNVSLSLALEITLKNLKENYLKLKESQNKLINELKEIKEVSLNSISEASIPNIVNFSLVGHNSEVIIRALSLKGVYVSSRSVCSIASKDSVSITLYSMGKNLDIATSSIRLSFDHPLNDEEISYFINSLKEVLESTHKKGV